MWFVPVASTISLKSAMVNGGWCIVNPFTKKTALILVDPGAVLVLDSKALQNYPEGYRHLAYIQTNIGYTVKMDMPMLKGEVVQNLYKQGADWLAGKPLVR
jgi:hypothetical protein